MLKQFWSDQNGALVSIELVLICTIGVLAMIVGWAEVSVAVNTELNDISNAIGALNQSYCFSGFLSKDRCKFNFFAGSCFYDKIDDCDKNDHDFVCGAPAHGEHGHHHHH